MRSKSRSFVSSLCVACILLALLDAIASPCSFSISLLTDGRVRKVGSIGEARAYCSSMSNSSAMETANTDHGTE